MVAFIERMDMGDHFGVKASRQVNGLAEVATATGVTAVDDLASVSGVAGAGSTAVGALVRAQRSLKITARWTTKLMTVAVPCAITKATVNCHA